MPCRRYSVREWPFGLTGAGGGVAVAGLPGAERLGWACARTVDVARNRQAAAQKHRKIVLIAFSSSAQTESI